MSHDRATGSFSICLTTPSGYLLYITQETRADRWFFVLDPTAVKASGESGLDRSLHTVLLAPTLEPQCGYSDSLTHCQGLALSVRVKAEWNDKVK